MASTVNWARTWARARSAMAARSGPASARAPASRSARAPASPGGTSQPVVASSATAGLGEHGLRRGADGGGDHRASPWPPPRWPPGRRLPARWRRPRHVRGKVGGGDILDVADEADVRARGLPARPGRATPARRRSRPWASPASTTTAPSSLPAAFRRAAASISTLWPFQPVSRATCRITRSPSSTPQRARRAATRSGAMRAGIERARYRRRDGSPPCAGARCRSAGRSDRPCSRNWR